MSAILSGSYNPAALIVTIGGVIVSGFSDGDHVVCEREEDNFSKRVGNDGAVGRARNPNKSGTVTVTLLQTSAANDALSALVAADDLINDGLVLFPITVADGSGRSLAAATQCWIKKIPNLTFGREVGDREWVFDCADLKIFVGGN
jgi:hypothetical protein